jgi:hypothetical protein
MAGSTPISARIPGRTTRSTASPFNIVHGDSQPKVSIDLVRTDPIIRT